MICLQHFLFDSEALPVRAMWIRADEGCALDRDGARGTFPDEKPGTIVFDGIANAFASECYAVNTGLSKVKLTGEFEGEMALEIWHAGKDGTRPIHGEDFMGRSGRWESPWIPVSSGDGRFYLSVRARNAFSLSDLRWEGDLPPPPVRPHFLVSVTTFKRERWLLALIRALCTDLTLKEFHLSFLVVDNGETIDRAGLPEDSRLTLVSQPNLGGTGGAMRGLWWGRKIKADFLVVADDDIVMSPETLYRMLILQSLSKRPLAVGAVMLTLDSPRTVVEQGGLLPAVPLSGTTMIHHGVNLDNGHTLPDLYVAGHCDYSGWWLMSAPVKSWSFLPPFFLHWDDVLQGMLLKERGVSIVVPASIFLWHVNLRPKNIPVWKRYAGMRNALSTLLIETSGLRPFAVVGAFRKTLKRFLGSYDYALSECCIQAFRDASRGPAWTHHPLEESRWIRTLMGVGPVRTDLSGKLSPAWKSSRLVRSRLGDRMRKSLYWVTLAGLLLPLSSTTASDGGLAFRQDGDYDAWKWTGYSQIAVVDDDGHGYVCRRSWRKTGELVLDAAVLAIRFLLTHRAVSREYRGSIGQWEKDWDAVFTAMEAGLPLPESGASPDAGGPRNHGQ